MSSISSMFAAGIDQVRKSWGWFLVSGIMLMVLGIACIGKAQTATTFSIQALGGVLAISGVFWLISSFQAWTWGGFFVYMLNAILRCVTGYHLLIRHSDAGAHGVTMVLAALVIAGGLFRVVGASAIQFPRWGWTVFQGWLVSHSVSIFWPPGVRPAPTLSALRSASTSSLTARRW